MKNEDKEIIIKRCPGAKQRLTIQSNNYSFKFLLSTVRLDRNIFDIRSLFIQKVKEQNNTFIFCNRGKRKGLLVAIEKDRNFIECFLAFDEITSLIVTQQPDITCYYNSTNAVLTVPNKEWWEYHKLESEFKQLTNWLTKYFK